MTEHLYIMRKGIQPLWEDKRNRSGGCWSIKVDLKEAFTLFGKIVASALGEDSMYSPENENISNHITGISFCAKNSFNAIIQIWNDDQNLSKISFLNPQLSESFVTDIIYRSHIPEY